MFEAVFHNLMTVNLRMRLQNEDAMLRSSIKLDRTLDRWRCLYEQLRHAALFADRGRLLELYEDLLLQYLPQLLREPSVDPTDPAALDVRGRRGLVPIVNARQHPRNWHLAALDMQLHRLINSSLDRAPPPHMRVQCLQAEAMGIVRPAAARAATHPGPVECCNRTQDV